MKILLLVILFPISLFAISFENWIVNYGLIGNDALPLSDPDHDGIVNLIEFGINNCDPVSIGDEVRMPYLVFNESQPALSLLTWTRRSNISGIKLIVEYSEDIINWVNYGPNNERLFGRLRAAHSLYFGEWSEEIDLRLANNSNKNIYITQDHLAAIYERNLNCWGHPINLTPISPWNSDGGNQYGGILISPRHVLFVTHYHPVQNSIIRFISSDNIIITRSVTSLIDLPTISSLYPDITIGVLDSDVPSSISFVKVLPADWQNYLPIFNEFRVPVICTDQEENLLCSDISGLTGGRIVMQFPSYTIRNNVSESIVSGDSGNPCCLVVNGELVLMCLLSFGGPGSGTFITDKIEDINNAMTMLGGGYQLSEFCFQ